MNTFPYFQTEEVYSTGNNEKAIGKNEASKRDILGSFFGKTVN